MEVEGGDSYYCHVGNRIRIFRLSVNRSRLFAIRSTNYPNIRGYPGIPNRRDISKELMFILISQIIQLS